MPSWQKGFRTLPAKTRAAIQRLPRSLLQVTVAKRLTTVELASGDYSHLRIDSSLTATSRWEVAPAADIGPTSKKNVEGWEVVRKDLPKYEKYFYHDIQNFGDGATYGWSTVAIPREVYHRDVFPPYLFHIVIDVREIFADRSVGVVFKIDQIFDRSSANFEDDVLFAVNLLQENCGAHGVADADDQTATFTEGLAWDLFPPGDMDAVLKSITTSRAGSKPPDPEEVMERLRLFEQFQPVAFLRGLGGNDHYIGARYADDLVVFENFRHGNALYVLYDDWELLSRKPRTELLKMSTQHFDRIVHTAGWEGRFAVLMQQQLQTRGLRVKIGRQRHRRQ